MFLLGGAQDAVQRMEKIVKALGGMGLRPYATPSPWGRSTPPVPRAPHATGAATAGHTRGTPVVLNGRQLSFRDPAESCETKRRRGRQIPPILGFTLNMEHTPRHGLGCPTPCQIMISVDKLIPLMIFLIFTPTPTPPPPPNRGTTFQGSLCWRGGQTSLRLVGPVC